MTDTPDQIRDGTVPAESAGRRGAFAALGAATLGAAAFAGMAATAERAAAQAPRESLLRTVISRGRLIVGTGSTNAPWHFEDERGQLSGMDIAMARILAAGLFDDPSKVEFVRQDPAQRIPNINTGRVDIVIQFMTINPQRAQLVAFSRPYYAEGVALLTSVRSRFKTYAELRAAGAQARASVLQNAGADALVKDALPDAQVMQLDTQANVIQAMESGRADTAVVDLSTVRWLVARTPDRYVDAGHSFRSQLYGAAMRQSDPDWLNFVNTVFNVNMFGHASEAYDKAMLDFFGIQPRRRTPGFPPI
jgi:polar amino acid transport system substrate-binding protein